MIPYVLGNGQRDSNERKLESTGEVGVDIKYSLTPSLTLDLTYNTDFAQVEVDEVQVNLDRFNLFFPEKRPFFLENAGLFSVGSPGEVDLFFSRRIGISDDGSLVPILGGLRLSGKQKNTNIAVLSMFTDEVLEKDIAANNFTVIRMNQQLANRTIHGCRPCVIAGSRFSKLFSVKYPTQPVEMTRSTDARFSKACADS